jgi:hypothetical protein
MSGADGFLAYSELRQLFRERPNATDAEAAAVAALDLDNGEDRAVLQAARNDAEDEAGPGTE